MIFLNLLGLHIKLSQSWYWQNSLNLNADITENNDNLRESDVDSVFGSGGFSSVNESPRLVQTANIFTHVKACIIVFI